MPCYVIVAIDVHDPEGFQPYLAGAPATVAAHGGRYVVRGATPERLEGEWSSPRVTILEFPDAEAAHAWHDSPEYAELKAIRQRASHTDAILVESPVAS
jgi:uncharacterized protein (DUF1330 family)